MISPGAPAEDGLAPVERALRRIAAVGSPVALATGLLFYFGWVRARVQGMRLGYDVSALDLSTSDYLLKSVNLVFLPVLLLLGLAILAQGADRRLIRRLRASAPAASSPEAQPRLVRTLRGLWLVVIPAGILLAVVAPGPGGYALSFALTAGLLAHLYGDALRRRLSPGGAAPHAHRLLVVLLLVGALFWNTERLARAAGEAYAATIAADLDRLLSVHVVADHDLGIDEPGVVRTRIAATTGSPALTRYDGLRLVDRGSSAYLLLPAGWTSDQGNAVLLRDDDLVLVEFSRSRR